MDEEKLVPKLRFEFSSKWESKKLKDIIQISKEKYNPDSDKTNYKCIELEHLAQETGLLLGYTNSINQNSIKNKFHKDNILFGKLRPYLKKFYYPNFDGVCSSEIWVFNTNEYSKYVYYLIQTKRFIDLSNVSSGSKMPRSDWNFMKDFIFPIPDIKTQKETANLFSIIDNKIELLENKYKVYQDFKKYLMQKIFAQELRFNEFDEEWKKVKLNDIAKVTGGKRMPKGSSLINEPNNHPYITVSNMNNDFEDLSTYQYVPTDIYPQIKNYIVNYNDLIISVAGTLGLVKKVPRCLDKANLTENANRISEIKIDIDYLKYYLNTIQIQNRIIAVQTNNAQPKLSLKEIRNFKILYPSPEEQEKIVSLISNVDKKIFLANNNLMNMQKFKKGLLQQMFI